MFSGVGCGIMTRGSLYRYKRLRGEVSIYNFKEAGFISCAEGAGCFIKRWENRFGNRAGYKEALAQDAESAKAFFNLTR